MRVDAWFGNNYHQPYPTNGFSTLLEGTALTPLCPEDLHHPPPEQGVVWPPAPRVKDHRQKGDMAAMSCKTGRSKSFLPFRVDQSLTLGVLSLANLIFCKPGLVESTPLKVRSQAMPR